MASKHVRRLVTAFAVLVLAPGIAYGQLSETAGWAIDVGQKFRSIPNVTYLTANQWEGKLDIYVPRDDSAGPHPTFIYFHGGAHVFGSKEASFLTLLPYLEMGWAVVNVEYRLAGAAHAPAAVEDCLCAVRWVIENAGDYNLDASRLGADGRLGGEPSGADLRHAARVDRPRPAVPGRAHRGGGGGELVRHHRRARAARGTARAAGDGPVVREQPEPAGAGAVPLAHPLRARGAAADHHRPR